MISVAIVILAGAIVYAARPRLMAVTDSSVYWDDGVISSSYDARNRRLEKAIEEQIANQRHFRLGLVVR